MISTYLCKGRWCIRSGFCCLIFRGQVRKLFILNALSKYSPKLSETFFLRGLVWPILIRKILFFLEKFRLKVLKVLMDYDDCILSFQCINNSKSKIDPYTSQAIFQAFSVKYKWTKLLKKNRLNYNPFFTLILLRQCDPLFLADKIGPKVL